MFQVMPKSCEMHSRALFRTHNCHNPFFLLSLFVEREKGRKRLTDTWTNKLYTKKKKQKKQKDNCVFRKWCTHFSTPPLLPAYQPATRTHNAYGGGGGGGERGVDPRRTHARPSDRVESKSVTSMRHNTYSYTLNLTTTQILIAPL